MPTIADVYRALNALENEKIVKKYAVCEGTAALFYDSETLRTYDIDVYVSLPQSGFLVSSSPIYEWAKAREYKSQDEHLMIHGVPVRVVKPELLALIYAKVGGKNRILRALDLLEGRLDQELLASLVEKYALQNEWKKLEALR